MSSIIKVDQIPNLRETLKRQNKTICLVGGCFDVLHLGHVIFLEKAKKQDGALIVLLESDQKIKKLKGQTRPVHTQKERAIILLALKSVDYVVMLPFMDQEEEYDRLIQKIKPDVIATTYGHPASFHYIRSAKKVGATLKYVTKMIGNHSTSGILNR